MWTILGGDEAVKEQLEKRTKERAEERAKEDGDDAALGNSYGCIPKKWRSKKWRSKKWRSKKTAVVQPLASRDVPASSSESI